MSAIIAVEGPDAGVPWHFGEPFREQRLLESPGAAVDLSHRGVLTVSGPDRLGWLHSLTTQYLEGLAPGVGVTTLVLSPQGHIEHALYGVDDGETFWAHTEPGAAAAAVAWLDRMRFMMRVEVADRTADYAVVWRSGPEPVEGRNVIRSGLDSLGGCEIFVPRADLAAALAETQRAGTWAYEARRISTGVPRIGVDSDHRTIPNELGLWVRRCTWRRAATAARKPWRGCTRWADRRVDWSGLHLDGSAEALPTRGSALELAGRPVGFVGGSARHYELGPVALGLVKRNVDPDAVLTVDGIAAAQELARRSGDRPARPTAAVSDTVRRRPDPRRGRAERIRGERAPRPGRRHRAGRDLVGVVG